MEDNHQIINFAPSSSSSSSVMSLKKYDVFLSFRGKDTRDNFTSHLYDALQKEVETYIDYRLEKGDEISQALIKAIQDSLVSVVIFSENYASSKWCLDEISMILECKRDHGQIVIPVFYKVDPSDVRKQTGSYKEAFAKHEQRLKNSDDDKLQKWRCALNEAANLAGWDSRTYRNESEFIKDILKDVIKKLEIRSPIELKGVVGIEENYAKVESLLEIGSTEVRVIGIWGMGGVGKTTLACALHAKLFSQFEGHCFLKNVREQSEKNGLDALRNRLFSDLLGEENLCVEPHFVTRKLRRKKVFIVLDDVATSEQLDDLISDYDCLAQGSRVIVTTRDKHIFSLVNDIYEVKELSYHASLQLFCLTAFREKRPKNGFEELSKSVIAYCKGNPLALKVLGPRLRSRNIEVWKSELRKLQKIQDVKIHNVLKMSFYGLDSDEKDIFLDIACFLKGEPREHITSLLDACGFFAAVGIEELIDKSLITISYFNRIEMHDLIQEMGRNVVCQESHKDPGRRSRLWDPEEVYDVLKNNKGTEVVECIILDVSKVKDLHLSFNSFTKMTEMRFLKFYSSIPSEGCKIYLPNGLESLSKKLRRLEWPGYCLESLPSTFCAEMLVKLVMPDSNIQKLWDGVQNVVNLKTIDLQCSRHLVELPDLSMATNLEVLSLDQCISLRDVHPSIFSLHKLWHLGLQYCTEIESLESNVHLKSIRSFNLTNCSSLKKFSIFSEKLETVWLERTSIQKLPSSIWHCKELHHMTLRDCYNLESFGIGNKSSHDPSLNELNLGNCCNLRALPDTIGSSTRLERLYLSGSNVEMLSPNIKILLNLRELRLDDCRKLVSLPELPPSLHMLSAINCTSLHTDITHLVTVVQHNIPVRFYEGPSGRPQYVVIPGDQVPDMFIFCAEGDSITFPQLPQSGLCGFICCLVLSHLPSGSYHGDVKCCINKRSTFDIARMLLWGTNSNSDHVLLCFLGINGEDDCFESGTCDLNSISFEFQLLDKSDGLLSVKDIIKRCAVLTACHYASREKTIEFQPKSFTFADLASL
ncbi:disease resistance protein RPV1-like isoform X2 [Lotus japonicus]|uniref:disease resistance protein RPV1-like isoform X2 n=1 Tax=Lotus japonicus TaxID=34305 RepID=UPI00258BEC70|nr:disease resistance protein RPV1-like isoform X2 [Lotus japonicus]